MDTEQELQRARKLYEQRAEASKRYKSKQAQITITLSREDNAAIRARASASGMSLKQFIVKKCLDS